MDPINISGLELGEVRAVNDEKVRWTGGFFSGPAVNQHWDDVMLPANTRVTGSPNAPDS